MNFSATQESPTRYEIRSVTRALDVLTTVADLGATDLSTIARTAGLHPTTTLRLLESLRTRGFVRQRRNLWEVGPRAFEVGSRFLNRVSLASEAQELVEELADRLKETANLGILVEGEVLYLAIAQAQRELGIMANAGGRHPADCTALGKVMLADMAWDDVESILAVHPPERRTPTTLIDRDAFRRELTRVAKQGYAVDREERTPGVVCVAAPIRDVSGAVVAAISISGPRMRFPRHRIASLAKEVIAIGEKGSEILGAPPTPGRG
jgi:DNA-binding IclR family transcriptional regulator